MPATDRPLVTTRRGFHELCDELRNAPRIAFDTEFIPERTYTPELCLIQVATDEFVTAIDPKKIDDVSEFWQLLVECDAQIIVHAGRSELEFCIAATGKLPSNVADIQLAAAFIGAGYPTSYSNLIHRLLSKKVQSAETRTNWGQRPLSARQIEYALDDVRFLIDGWEKAAQKLNDAHRWDWYESEMTTALAQLTEDRSTRVRRIAGTGGLKPRGIAVLHEILAWREERAKSANRPPKWILRNDILSELAKRQPTTLDDLRSTRGLGWDGKSSWAKELLAAIQRGLAVPEDQLPQATHRRESTEEQMVIKILAAAMLQRGGDLEIATGLIGTNEDLRDLLDWYRAGSSEESRPLLMTPWREDAVGRFLIEILAGRVSARVQIDGGTAHLHFEPLDAPASP